MFKRLKSTFKRFAKDKEFIERREEIPITTELSRREKYRELTTTEFETIISLLNDDPAELISKDFVQVDWNSEEIVDLTGDSVKADARLKILVKKGKKEYDKNMRGKSLKNLKSRTNPLERIKNKPLEKIFKDKKIKDTKKMLSSNPHNDEKEILNHFAREIEEHFKEKVRHYEK